MSNHDEDDILDTYVNRAEGARRGAVISSEGKRRITIYLDNDVLDHFRKVAVAKGRGYQTEINNCLRQAIQQKSEQSVSNLRARLHGVTLQAGGVVHGSEELLHVSHRNAFDVRQARIVGRIRSAGGYVVSDQLRVTGSALQDESEARIGVCAMESLDLVPIHLLARQA